MLGASRQVPVSAGRAGERPREMHARECVRRGRESVQYDGPTEKWRRLSLLGRGPSGPIGALLD